MVNKPYDPTTGPLDIYPRKTEIDVYENTYAQMFIAAWFVTTPNWKKLKYPSTNTCINKVWYIHTMEHHSVIKITYKYPQQNEWFSKYICCMK